MRWHYLVLWCVLSHTEAEYDVLLPLSTANYSGTVYGHVRKLGTGMFNISKTL